MVNQITEPPNDYKFGLSFNYTVWTPGTSVSLVNVPWNNDYRDIVRFADKVALDNYLDSLELSGVRIEQLSYIKPNQPVRINKPINEVINYNYLRASNPLQPIPGNDRKKNYYYFINDVRYLAPNATELVLQLDVWQTFGYDVTFGTAFVERGHIGIANTKQFDKYGRDYLTVPEGLDVGGEYRVISRKSKDIIGYKDYNASAPLEEGQNYDVLVISTVDLEELPGTEAAPMLKTPQGSEIDSVDNGAQAYVFPGDGSFSSWLFTMRDYPWITQGIISITTVPKLTRYDPDFVYAAFGEPKSINVWKTKSLYTKMFEAWRDSLEIANAIPEKYRHLKKLWTFPYMGIELTTWSATPVSLKPESWQNPDAALLERLTLLPPNQRVQFFPRSYNSNGQEPLGYHDLTTAQITAQADYIQSVLDANPGAFEFNREEWINRRINIGDDFGDYLDIVTQIASFPQGVLVNNGGIAYLASNAHSIAYQRQSASWAETKTLAAARTGFDQANSGIRLADAVTDIGIRADRSQTGVTNRNLVGQAAVSAAAGVVGGAAGGAFAGPTGAAIGAIGGALSGTANLINSGIQTSSNDESLAIRNLAANQTLDANVENKSYIRDTNKTLADWAARGDYANEIAGINARVQDAQLIQPTVSGQFGGDAANHAHGTSEVSVRWKLIDDASIRRVGDFWLRYGYAINAFIDNIPSDMMVMSKFTYWKMTQTYLLSSPMPELMKQAIRGIFEKGVTVWRNPDDIGTIDIGDNTALEGISY